jgi:hypothetical protein
MARSRCHGGVRERGRSTPNELENILRKLLMKQLFENVPSEKNRTVNLFLPSLLWANSQLRRLLASGACPMISYAASCRTGERGS